MSVINRLIALLLGLFAAFLAAVPFLGTLDYQDSVLREGILPAFGGRFLWGAVLGAVGAAAWWLLNLGLREFGLVKNVRLAHTARVLATGVVIGAFLGALLFCFT